MTTHISRRFFLASACCAAAAPIVTAGDIGNTIFPGMTFDRSASYLR